MGLAVLKTGDLPHYTYDDYIQWEGRWEIIKGIPYAMVPAPAFKDRVLKYQLYREAGVKYYCIVDPESKSTPDY